MAAMLPVSWGPPPEMDRHPPAPALGKLRRGGITRSRLRLQETCCDTGRGFCSNPKQNSQEPQITNHSITRLALIEPPWLTPSDLHLKVGPQYTTFTFPQTARHLLFAGDIGRLADNPGLPRLPAGPDRPLRCRVWSVRRGLDRWIIRGRWHSRRSYLVGMGGNGGGRG